MGDREKGQCVSMSNFKANHLIDAYKAEYQGDITVLIVSNSEQ